jgi:hypothetical protein
MRHSQTLKGKDMHPYKYRCKEWDAIRKKYRMTHSPVKNGICQTCGVKVRGWKNKEASHE